MWAVLVGIDLYSKKHDDANLYGCVADVEDMRHMLETRLKTPCDNTKV
jgi:hypothetical protein